MNRTMVGLIWIAQRAPVAALAATLVGAMLAWSGPPGRAAESPSSVAEPLDGQTFRAGIVQVGEEADGPLEDELMFRDGKFMSAICKRYNFVEAPYWVRQEGDRIHFLAELTSPTDGRMLWKGTIEDGKLEGTMRWTKQRWYWTIDTEHVIRGEIEEGAPGASSAAD